MEIVIQVATALGVAAAGGLCGVGMVGMVELAVVMLDRDRRRHILKRSLRENIRQALS